MYDPGEDQHLENGVKCRGYHAFESVTCPSCSNIAMEEHITNDIGVGPSGIGLGAKAALRKDLAHSSPSRKGPILYLKACTSLEEAELSCFPSGFLLKSSNATPDFELMVPWSPFSIIRKRNLKCGKYTTVSRGLLLKVIGNQGDDQSHYFMLFGDTAIEDRNTWLRLMVRAIALATKSLFPETPEQVLPPTSNRSQLKIGHLLLYDGMGDASLFYCEVATDGAGKGRCIVHSSQERNVVHLIVNLSETTLVNTYKGVHTNVFRLDLYLFCARSRDDKERWLQAICAILSGSRLDSRLDQSNNSSRSGMPNRHMDVPTVPQPDIDESGLTDDEMQQLTGNEDDSVDI